MRRARSCTGAALAAWLTFAACPFGTSYAAAPSYDERLDAGEVLRFPQSVQRGSAHLIGGLAYAMVPGTSARLEELAGDVDAWKWIFPRTKDARVVERQGDDLYVQLTQGNALVEATYTLHLHLDRSVGEARFWLVKNRPHDIEDAWGFFRFSPAANDPSRSLVTFGLLVDVGGGMFAGMLEPKVQHAVLTVPDRLREYLSREASR